MGFAGLFRSEGKVRERRRGRRALAGLLLLSAANMAGCAGGGERVTVDLQDADVRGKANPSMQVELLEGGLMVEYHLEMGDGLRIDFFFNPELSKDVVVRPDGRITLAPIGEIMAVGRTPRDVASEIEDRFSDILLQPSATVTVKEVATPVVYVIGLVTHPGPISYGRNMTAVSAIAAAGGPDSGAKLSSVIVLRRVSTTKVSVARVDLGRVYAGKDLGNDLYLEPYDIVFVPKRFISSLRDIALDVVQTVGPAINVYLRGWVWQ